MASSPAGVRSKTALYRVYKEILRPQPEMLAGFAEVGTADVLDALPAEALMDTALRPIWPGGKIIGPAVTALNVPGDTLMLHYAVEACQPGDVLVIVSDGPSPSAMWGKMVSVSTQARGAAGAVVDGFARDTDYIRESRFPVWSRGVSPRGSTRQGPGGLNVPVMCGGSLVYPGDWIFADDDGILVIRPGQAQAALEMGRKRLAREESLMPRLRQGASPFELLGLSAAARAAGLEEQPGRYPDNGQQDA